MSLATIASATFTVVATYGNVLCTFGSKFAFKHQDAHAFIMLLLLQHLCNNCC